MIITGKKFSKPEMSRVINGDIKLSEAPEKVKKTRLDHILMAAHPEFNRSSLQKFIKEGRVTVSGEVIKKPNYLVEDGQEVVLDLPEDLKDPTIKTEKIAALRPNTIYEDENVLVLNKPAGLLSMAKGEYCPEPTLEDYGLLVHRLDRDTSGVVILAKTSAVQSMLRRQFQERKTHKTYYAVVEGRPKLDEALINLPIARNLKHPTTFQVDVGGKASETYYKVVKSGPIRDEKAKEFGLKPGQILSLLELKPKTGRTHQLRVHLKYIGTPILGDTVYGADTRYVPRLFLHAAALEITIPVSQRKVFEAPLPPEFDDVF